MYATAGAAGADLKARLDEPLVVLPGQRVRVPTGVRCALPEGYEGQVRPRSGLADRHGLTVLNAPGTVDSDYRGEIQVLLVNLGNSVCTIQPYDRIAQLVIAPVTRAVFESGELRQTSRGSGGFGSTGV
ncbi:MAG: dUTP diphosphatase [Spirochaetaceae bacterium]|nr:MAG: dUTP diphosphatase [Spirochaetaceae bacterium]